MSKYLGIFADLVSIFTAASGLFPGPPNWPSTSVRIHAALNGDGLSGAEGEISNVRTFNQNQELIGNSGSGWIDSGAFHDWGVSQPTSQQAPFVQVHASNNAVCISYVSATWQDGSKYTWVGDFGAYCGLEWYWGRVYVDNGS